MREWNGPLPTVAELRAHEEKRRRRLRTVRLLLGTAAVVYLLFGVVFGAAVVDGGSMLPGVPSGSVVLFRRLGPPPRKGEVVLFYAASDRCDLIKRVAATAGDAVSVGADGGLCVNGRAESGGQSASRATGKMTDEKSLVGYPLKVPVETVFVLGDNRSDSLDSRQLGVVSLRRVTGVAFLVLRLP